MGDQTIRNSIRLALFGAAAVTASIGWAQESEPPTSTSSATQQSPTATESPTGSPTEAAESNAIDETAAQPSSPTQSTVVVDDQKLEKFADAYVAVQKIQTEAAGELDKAAGDPEKQQQTQAAVENQMIAAVERTGLKLDEFNGIVQTMTADADLRAKVVAKIRERMKG